MAQRFNIEKFEAALSAEYGIMYEMDYLKDGTVRYDGLKARLIEKHGFTAIQVEDAIHTLIKTRVGMISKDNVWIQVREAY